MARKRRGYTETRGDTGMQDETMRRGARQCKATRANVERAKERAAGKVISKEWLERAWEGRQGHTRQYGDEAQDRVRRDWTSGMRRGKERPSPISKKVTNFKEFE